VSALNKLSRIERLVEQLENELEVTRNGHVDVYNSVEECLAKTINKINEILDPKQ
jgi:hypothetical protein